MREVTRVLELDGTLKDRFLKFWKSAGTKLPEKGLHILIMVYVIRHKGFWEFRAGSGYYDQTFHSFIKTLVPPKEQTLFISRKNTSYFAFRYLHVYRIIKRAAAQFFAGNDTLLNSFTLSLRAYYKRVPVEMVTKRYGGWDMLIHKGERHWELMTYNQHPLQHDIYELFNSFCEASHGRTLEESQKEEEFGQAFVDAVESKRKRLGLATHELLEVTDLSEIYNDLMKKVREDASSVMYVKPQSQKDAEFDAENPRRPSFFH